MLGLLTTFLALTPLSWAAEPVSEQEADRQMRQSLEKITKAYQLTVTNLAVPVDPEHALFDGAIRGALSRLDPFSVFLDPGQFEAFQQQQRGVQQGFGAVLNVQAGGITVLQSFPESPFGRAGLGPGDRIVRINGHRVAGLGLRELVEVLQEARKGRVRLSVLQGGKVVPADFELDPAELPSPTVDKHFLLRPDIGYLHVARMEDKTPEEIAVVLREWEGQDLQGLVLDLRDNPGGSLESTVSLAGLFLPEGAPVVSLRGRSVPELAYAARKAPLRTDLPIVALINGRTASAAEIIAAALQEHDRAWLVGQTTYGKGVAESVLPLSQGAALVLTTARHFTPAGRSVQQPLPGTALAGILQEEKRKFFSYGGRSLSAQGGVAPDQETRSWQLDPWAAFLQESTAFLNFAQSYVDVRGRIGEAFAVDDEVLALFQRYLLGAGVRVPPESWERSVPFLRVRIRTELFNLVYGISWGDEVEAKGDPQVQAAVEAMEQARQLLRLPSKNEALQEVHLR